ncbi:MAG: flagellar motor switch protein FliG [Treponema sp.]|nr:MAG: flagellar motor switch protein FliG [Treponema sp.]
MTDIESMIQEKGLVKVPKKEKDSKYRRVAKFLFLIGPKQAAVVLRKLDDNKVDKVIAELITIRNVPKEEALEILDEFTAIYEENKGSYGGVGTAKQILEEAYGDEKAAEILERAVPQTLPKPFVYLDGIENDRLHALLKDELPSACAVVLSHLPPKQAAQYISGLKDDAVKKKDIVLHLAKMQKLNMDVLQNMSDALRQKLVNIRVDRTSELDGKSVLAKILRTSNLDSEKMILEKLAEDDEELAEEILKQIYTFDDLLNMSDNDVQFLVSPLSDLQIRTLIHNRKADIRQKLLSNISKNRALLILDDEKALDPPRQRDCLDAETEFVNKMVECDRTGKVIIPKDESDKLVY